MKLLNKMKKSLQTLFILNLQLLQQIHHHLQLTLFKLIFHINSVFCNYNKHLTPHLYAKVEAFHGLNLMIKMTL